MARQRTRPTLFPYTTLFRSVDRSETEEVRMGAEEGERADRIRAPQRESSSVLPCEGLRKDEDRIRRADERSEEHTSELQSPYDLVCRLLLEKNKNISHARST